MMPRDIGTPVASERDGVIDARPGIVGWIKRTDPPLSARWFSQLLAEPLPGSMHPICTRP